MKVASNTATNKKLMSIWKLSPLRTVRQMYSRPGKGIRFHSAQLQEESLSPSVVSLISLQLTTYCPLPSLQIFSLVLSHSHFLTPGASMYVRVAAPAPQASSLLSPSTHLKEFSLWHPVTTQDQVIPQMEDLIFPSLNSHPPGVQIKLFFFFFKPFLF